MTRIRMGFRNYLSSTESKGFALPTVLIASIIMLSVLLVSVSSTVAIRASLASQYYNLLSKNAADAGVAYANSCLSANNGIAQWTNPLKPGTDCNGTQLAGFTCPDNSVDSRCSVSVNDNNITSSFSVAVVTPSQIDPNGRAMNISSSGSTKLLRSSDSSVWRQYGQFVAYAVPQTAAPIIATGNITGTTTVGSVLTSPTISPVGAAVTYKWQSSATSGGTYSDIPGATSSTYTLVLADWGNYIRVVISAVPYNYIGSITSTTPQIGNTGWVAGQAETGYPTTLLGKFIKSSDEAGYIVWKTTATSCGGPQCAIGADDGSPGSNALVSPQIYPLVSFTGYSAQLACKAVSGRLPKVDELRAIRQGNLAGHYGSFQPYQPSYYWTDLEYRDTMSYGLDMGSTGILNALGKNSGYYVRCVH